MESRQGNQDELYDNFMDDFQVEFNPSQIHVDSNPMEVETNGPQPNYN